MVDPNDSSTLSPPVSGPRSTGRLRPARPSFNARSRNCPRQVQAICVRVRGNPMSGGRCDALVEVVSEVEQRGAAVAGERGAMHQRQRGDLEVGESLNPPTSSCGGRAVG